LELTRRGFLKVSGVGTLGLLSTWSLSKEAFDKGRRFTLHKKIKEGYTVCPYCAVGCGVIVANEEGSAEFKIHGAGAPPNEGISAGRTTAAKRVINCEGDPDHPINRGRLDPKSISGRQVSNSELRLDKPLYRAPGSNKWEEKSWDWTISEIAKRIKKTRDATFKEQVGGVTVNRTEAIACLGGAANNNEDCYLLSKLMRPLGVVYLEHQARI